MSNSYVATNTLNILQKWFTNDVAVEGDYIAMLFRPQVIKKYN